MANIRKVVAVALAAILSGCTAGYGSMGENGGGSVAFARIFTSSAIKIGPEGFDYTSDPAADALKELAATALTAAPFARSMPQECSATPWPETESMPAPLSPMSAREPAVVMPVESSASDVEALMRRLRATKRRIET